MPVSWNDYNNSRLASRNRLNDLKRLRRWFMEDYPRFFRGDYRLLNTEHVAHTLLRYEMALSDALIMMRETIQDEDS